MKVELELTKEEFKEFLDIVQDDVENGGQPYETVMDNILGQLLEIDSKMEK